MAHLSDLGSEFGTSFAGPRACGNAGGALAGLAKRVNCTDATALMCEAYNLTMPLTNWGPRIGFHKQTT